MTKSQLIAAAAQNSGLSQKAVSEAYDALYNAFANAIAAGEAVQIAGVGTFSVKARAARKGFNPKTQQPIEIAASKAIAFSAAKALKDKLN